ncbi:MAG: hypothetical protein JNG83_06615 [Opitutaceae bacterium]|nr:hypothetical protein [Opitutaceae bacterium]
MKFIFLAGGLAGFLLAAASGLQAGRSPDRVLLDAALGCLAGALLFRWLWSVLLRGFREAYLNRQRAAASTESAAAQPKP